MADAKPKVTYRRVIRKAPLDVLADPEPSVVEHSEDVPPEPVGEAPKKKRSTKRKAVSFQEPAVPPASEPEPEELATIPEEEDDDFLHDLKNHAPVVAEEPPPPQFTPPPASVPDFFVPESSLKLQRGGKKSSAPRIDSFSDMFSSSSPTPLYGKDRRAALMRLKEYKHLFPEQLKDLKLKPNPSLSDIQDALDEAEVITSANGIHTMLNDAVFSAVAIVEGVSARFSAVDISGTTEALRRNQDFLHSLKLCWIKHRVFSSIPPEARCALIVTATMTHQMTLNRRKARVDAMLSQPL